MYAENLDLEWFRGHLLDEILPKWLMAVTDQGLFLPHFSREWQPLQRNYGTLVSQCRLLYNFSQGHALTGDTRYLHAVEGGAQFLLEHFKDKRYGGWYWSCGVDGDVQDRHKDGYGHAFALFGLAHAYQCTGNAALQEAMMHTWEIVHRHFRDEHGGVIWRMSEAFEVNETFRSQNPVMHLFEALVAVGTVGGIEQMLEEARDVGDFVLLKLVRASDRRLPEVYNPNWEELPPGDDGAITHGRATTRGRFDIGHAFEWAYLASYAVEKGLPARYMNYANSFMLYGMALGFDWHAGGIYSPAFSTGQLMNQRKGWWEQCETIRALTHFVVRHQRDDLLEPLQKTIRLVQSSFIDPEYGGWYPWVEPDVSLVGQEKGPKKGPKKGPEKGNEWKVDYHIVGMCMEAIRLANLINA